ncbi:MAG: hypothetical protein XXXJIFNMEKO3_00039 [Candidatus Erwinia impunctatus]|nr:hypothetical protein XXXJIFNMEKO_00039 [Culicoides impunctatus]
MSLSMLQSNALFQTGYLVDGEWLTGNSILMLKIRQRVKSLPV